MNAQDVLNLGNQFISEGDVETGQKLFLKVTQVNPNFSPVWLLLHNIYRSQGNLLKAKECLVSYIKCPLTGETLESIPVIKAQIAEIDKQMNPQIQQPPVTQVQK